MSNYQRLVAQLYKVTHQEPKEEPAAAPVPTADEVDGMDSVMGDLEVAA